MTFAATVLTLYPEMFPGLLGTSLAGKALERGDWSLATVNPRDFTTDKHRTVDATPAGGGAIRRTPTPRPRTPTPQSPPLKEGRHRFLCLP